MGWVYFIGVHLRRLSLSLPTKGASDSVSEDDWKLLGRAAVVDHWPLHTEASLADEPEVQLASGADSAPSQSRETSSFETGDDDDLEWGGWA